MRLFKKHTDALASVLHTDAVGCVKDVVGSDAVRGWSVFDVDGVEIAGEGVSETTIAVCSNAIDLATNIGAELNETDPKPTITFMKGAREMQTVRLDAANLLVLRDNANGTGKEARHGR